MGHSRVVAHRAAGDAAAGEPARHAQAHGGAHLAIDTRPKPDCHENANAGSNTNTNADAHAGAVGQSDGHPYTDANDHTSADGGANGIAHSQPDGIADARTDGITHAHANANADALGWHVVPA
jgi:hypothetical protein